MPSPSYFNHFNHFNHFKLHGNPSDINGAIGVRNGQVHSMEKRKSTSSKLLAFEALMALSPPNV